MSAQLAILRSAPPTAWFGLVIIAAYAGVAMLAPLIAPFAEREVVGGAFDSWSARTPLGTDHLGRDLLTRLLYGARNTVGIALATTVIAFLVGGALGMLAGARGGHVDRVLGWLVDLMMAIPSLILALLLLTVFGTSIASMVMIIAAIESTRVFRLARTVAQGIAAMDYVDAARLRGERMAWLIAREILPNAAAPLIAEFGLRFCFIFLFISALSFLGLGIQPPTADWGSMVRENAMLITFGDPTPLLPAGAIALLTIAVNFVVDWMLQRWSGLKD